MKKTGGIWFLSVLVVACTHQDKNPADPKVRLKDYVVRSFSAKGIEDRKAMENYLTGQALERLKAWSNDQFLEAFVDKKKTFKEVVFKDLKNISDTEINVTYEVVYTDQVKENPAEIVNKKICTLVFEDNRWMIREAKNLKLLVQFQNEMSLP